MKIDPIGIFRSSVTSKSAAPRQGNFDLYSTGTIEIKKEFAQGMKNLEGIERIWLLFHFHQNKTWKHFVLPPTSSLKRGVFSTRSPYRPNFIGLTCCKIEKIISNKIVVSGTDLLDETPIFDIKPYLPYADSFPHSEIGWIEEERKKSYRIQWKKNLQKLRDELLNLGRADVIASIEQQLSYHPTDKKRKRIQKLADNEFEFSFRFLRCRFRKTDEPRRKVDILELKSVLPTKASELSLIEEGDLLLHQKINESPGK